MRGLRALAAGLLLAMPMPAAAHAQASGDAVEAGAGTEALTRAKASIASTDYAQAIEFLNKAAAAGPIQVRREAMELAGVVREKANQLAQAKAAYEDYLKAFPSGPDASRVRQRLEGVVAATTARAEAAFNLNRKTSATPAPPAPAPSPKRDLPAPAAPEGWHWDVSGSAGQFFYRDDSFDNLGLRGTLGDHAVNQSDIVSSADLTLHAENGANEIKARVSAYEANSFDGSGDAARSKVSAAYVDMRNRLSGLSLRAGRQSHFGSGLFGRFDGVLLGYDVSKALEIQAFAGSPVYYGVETPFADNRYFVGGSVTAATADKRWVATAYALQQNVGAIVDRRAVGSDLRYTRDALQANATLDFDIYYKQLNDIYAGYSWQANRRLSVYGSADYRRVPFLLTSDALMGQTATSLSSLIEIFGITETQALAVDRTATAATASGGFAYELSDRWQIGVDASVAHYSGTPASGGVSAIPAPGMEYWLSAQLTGTSIFAADDDLGLGMRVLKDSDSVLVIADASLRYPVSEALRLNPRLRLAYRTGSGQRQVYAMPSFGLQYRLARHWLFETEAAVRWEADHAGNDSSRALETMISAGYRYEF